MPGQLARLFGFAAPPHRTPGPVMIVDVPFDCYLSDEISEYDRDLSVRLRAGRAMQVQLRESDILTRTVPIANATQIGEHPPWQPASDSCVLAWIQSNAAIWRWLVAKGIDEEATKARLAEALMTPRHNVISV